MIVSTYKVIGLMSGTSMDGVDAVLIETDGENHIEVIENTSIHYPNEFKVRLKEAEESFGKNLSLSDKHIDLPLQSTQFHIDVIEKLINKLQSRENKIDLIGYHGQTLCHKPKNQFTFQMGEPQHLADHFNIPVVFDFRSNDLKNGGQGAPLAPLYHQALMNKKNLDGIIMINCGGISNISVITGSHHEDIHAGFDTGPGNCLIDRWIRENTNNNETYDKDGQYGLRGKINHDLVQILLEKSIDHSYYQKTPPKSLDSREILFIPEIMNHCESIEDGAATLAFFTAFTISENINLLRTTLPSTAIIAGGGAKNPVIVNHLKQLLKNKNIDLFTADEFGLDSTYMEAELMAWLAVRSIRNLPLTIPQTTGVKEPTIGGTIYYPRQS